MQSNFEFLREKFPELADDGRKAEKYLYSDNEVCMFFISRIFDNIVKYICKFHDVKNNGTNLAEPISELFRNKAIDESIYLTLEMMRTFRNGNAHNKDYSLNDSMILLQVSHFMCEWLMETYGELGYHRKGFIMPGSEIYKIGDVLECTVNKVMSYGLFVDIGAMNALIHKSEIPSGTTQGYNDGDKITAKIIDIDNVKGHAALSITQLQPTQQPLPSKPKAPAMSDDDFLKLCSTETPQKISDAIKNGANVNAVNSKGHTALMMAAMKNTHYQVIGLLINSGADVNARSKRGLSALDYTATNKHVRDSEVIARLQSLTK